MIYDNDNSFYTNTNGTAQQVGGHCWKNCRFMLFPVRLSISVYCKCVCADLSTPAQGWQSDAKSLRYERANPAPPSPGGAIPKASDKGPQKHQEWEHV